MSTCADIIITNAYVFTSNELNLFAEAVTVKGNRVVYVGSRAGVEEWRGRGTRVVDGGGSTLLPGFIDLAFSSFVGHYLDGECTIAGSKEPERFERCLLAFASENRTSPWVVGRGIKYGIVSTRQELDAIIANRPIYVGAYDGHTAWANTKALEMAGILHPGKRLAERDCRPR